MKISKAVIVLCIFAALFGLVQAGAGLFWQTDGQPFTFTTLHGESVQIEGRGIYAFDTAFKVPILRGTDAVSLFLVLPLLVIALLLYRRGSLRGGVLLVGVLAFYVYNSASLALGAAYNNLFLVYVAYFSTSLFAFILAFNAIDGQALATRVEPGFPHTGTAVLMFVSGLALLVAWLGDILGALATGGVPDIGSYTTEVTYVIDLGIIAPLTVLAGIQVLRHGAIGYRLALLLMVLLAIVGVMVSSQTAFQLAAGIDLPIPVLIGKTVSFVLLAVFAVGILARTFRKMG